MFINSLIILVLTLLINNNTKAQHTYKPKDPSLEKTIFKQDSLLFDAFNRQDLKTLSTFFSPDLEFYNDGGGDDRFSNDHRKLQKYVRTQ